MYRSVSYITILEVRLEEWWLPRDTMHTTALPPAQNKDFGLHPQPLLYFSSEVFALCKRITDY